MNHCVIHSGTPSAPVGDVVIGDRVIIGHGTVLHCRRIDNGVLIGMNASVLHDAESGEHYVMGLATRWGKA
jgi:carbonic anhydrase/acetyltransferase-like protein (isoleucine patch superfamily)